MTDRMTAVAKLLPCPFCGRSNLIISRMHGTGDRYVVCQTPECKTCGPSGDAREDAIAAWNRRAALSPAELGGVEAAVACHRLCTGDPPSRWMWIDGPASLGAMDQARLHGWRIENAYTTPRAAEAVTEEMVEAFARVYWKGDWPFKPDTEANRELIAEFRDVIKRGLTAALLTPPSAKGEL